MEHKQAGVPEASLTGALSRCPIRSRKASMLHPGGGGSSQTFVLQLYLHHADDSTCAARLNAMTDTRTQLGADEWSSVCSRAVSAAGNSSRSKEEAGSGSLSSERPLRARQGRAVREGGSMRYLLAGGMTTFLSHLSRSALAGGVRVRPASQWVCVYSPAVPAANLCLALIACVHTWRHGQFRRACRRS